MIIFVNSQKMYLCKAVPVACFWVLSDKKPKKSTRFSKTYPPTILRKKFTRTKVAINNLYPLALIRTSIYRYLWTDPLGPKWSLVPNNILYQHWYENQIKGHHMGESKLILESLYKANSTVQLLLKITWFHNYLHLPSNMTPLVA